MKHILFSTFFLLGFHAISQVPEPMKEMSIEAPKPDATSKNAGYYQQDGKYGFVYPRDTRQEAVYDKITYALNGFIVQKGNVYGITDKQGSPVGTMDYDSVGIFYNTYLVKKNGKYGTLSDSGKLVLPVKYDKILGGNKEVSFVQNKKGDVVLVFNETGKVFSQKIEDADVYANLAIVKANGKFGVIKKDIVVPFEYDSISYRITTGSGNKLQKDDPFAFRRSNLSRSIFDLVVSKNGKLGLVSSEGAVIYPAENEEISRVDSKNYYLVRKDNLYSIYFKSANRRTAFEFDRIYADGYGYVMAVKNDKSGVFNLQGELIVPFEYDNDFIAQLSPGLRVTKDKKRGIIDPEGKILVPAIYEDVSTFYESGFKEFIKVKLDGKYGVVNLDGKLIIPAEFEWIGVENSFFQVVTPEPDRKSGLYDKTGHVVVPAEYRWITNSATENSNIIILEKENGSYNFLDEKNELILPENASEYGYVPDEENLLHPFSSTRHYLMYVKSKEGKYGMLNEMSGTLDIPMVYDKIIQRFESSGHIYYSVQKGKKSGLINERNEVLIPFEYDDISLDLITTNGCETNDENCFQVVVAKGKKYGTVNLKNEVQIPFQYAGLQRISATGLYKARKGKQYQVIRSDNKPLSAELFDEVANFEQVGGFEYGETPVYQVLTFSNGKMCVMDDNGNFITSAVSMQPHKGYRSFDELKFALVTALDSPDDALLRDFADKIAPSEHLLYYLKRNVFNDQPLEYMDMAAVKERYYTELLKFKSSYWDENSGLGYHRSSLIDVTDYTLYRDGYLSNTRNTDHAFGDTRYLEKFLRNAVKINGFWISSYFMKHRF